MDEPSELSVPWSEDAPYYTDHETDAIFLELDDSERASLSFAAGPFGAGATETSEFLGGSVTVAVFTMESNGPSENWTAGQITNVKAEIVQALNNWIVFEPNAGLSFTYIYNDQAATTYEPIQGPSTADALWMQEVMNAIGYADPSVWVNLYDYANDLRHTHSTDWAYSVFVVNDANDADKMFSNFWSAYAYLGGPATVMTYDNGTTSGNWGIARMDMVFSHETGHIFSALDEYFGSCAPCTAASGYLWVQNQNCDLTGFGGCALNQNCVMRNNNIAVRCPYTRGQLGLADTDGDTIPDVRDTFPETVLTPFTPNPTAAPLITYAGHAKVSPLPRGGGPGNAISVNTIAGVTFRVGGIGPWSPAQAVDGAFDEAVEDYAFSFGPLLPGTYLVEARARNDVANVDATAAADSLRVVTAPAAAFMEDATSGTAPFTVRFTDTSSGYVTGWVWDFGDGGTSSQQHPDHQFTVVGTFTVALTASGGGVSNTMTKPNLVSVTCPPPTADFSPSVHTGTAPLTVMFIDASTSYTGCDIMAWAWDFGDGGSSSEQHPVHTFAAEGRYSIALTVTNAAANDTKTATDMITVTPSADDDAADDDTAGDDDADDEADDDAAADDDASGDDPSASSRQADDGGCCGC
ncbi:MAG: PKD domain-containing protein [Deltaproteobacteria bacterium]|nr:PKD domain-containing protein [Deltaproteobacteria bacterium]